MLLMWYFCRPSNIPLGDIESGRSAGSLAAAVHLAHLKVVSSPSIVPFDLIWEVKKKELDDPDDQQNFPGWNESQSVHSHLSACTLTKCHTGRLLCMCCIGTAGINRTFIYHGNCLNKLNHFSLSLLASTSQRNSSNIAMCRRLN